MKWWQNPDGIKVQRAKYILIQNWQLLQNVQWLTTNTIKTQHLQTRETLWKPFEDFNIECSKSKDGRLVASIGTLGPNISIHISEFISFTNCAPSLCCRCEFNQRTSGPTACCRVSSVWHSTWSAPMMWITNGALHFYYVLSTMNPLIEIFFQSVVKTWGLQMKVIHQTIVKRRRSITQTEIIQCLHLCSHLLVYSIHLPRKKWR